MSFSRDTDFFVSRILFCKHAPLPPSRRQLPPHAPKWLLTRPITMRWASSPPRPNSRSKRLIARWPLSTIPVHATRLPRAPPRPPLTSVPCPAYPVANLFPHQTRTPTTRQPTKSSRSSAKLTKYSPTRTCAPPMTSLARTMPNPRRASPTRPSSSRPFLAARPLSTGLVRLAS